MPWKRGKGIVVLKKHELNTSQFEHFVQKSLTLIILRAPFRALEVATEEGRGVGKVSRMKRLWLQFDIFRSEQMDRAGYWQYTNMGQKASIVFFPFSVLTFQFKNNWNKLTFIAYQSM